VSNRGVTSADSIRRNDWGSIDPPVMNGWVPSLNVSVIIADETDQKRLDDTLAALRHQTYPADLLDVIVVDGGPPPALELPELRPERCRLLAAAGRARFPAGVAASTAEMIVRLEPGVVVAPEFVAALARWQHVAPDTVSIAPLAEVTSGWASPDEISDQCANGTVAQSAPAATGTAPAELTRLLAASHNLRTADHLGFLAVAGMPFAFRRDRYRAGTDRYEGADVEVGFRLAQAGTVFLPEPLARAWRLRRDEPAELRHRRHAELANLLPYPRANRRSGGRAWDVPLVTAVVPADGSYEIVRACVDRLLGGDETDLRVLLVGDWDGLPADGSDRSDLGLLATEYRSEPRVGLVGAEPVGAFPSPYLLRVPSRLGVGPTTVRSLIATADRWQAGLIRVLPAAAGSGSRPAELWRTAALSRAQRTAAGARDLVTAVGRSHGERWETGSEYHVVDLSGAPAPAAPAARGNRRGPETVSVGGARSLAKATAFVTRRYARAAKRRIVRR
jgi:hypothetical protein